MCNNEIIYREACALAKDGKIKIITVGDTVTPEAIHTYEGWKARGYQVKRGEKAIAKFTIWKYAEKKSKTETDADGEAEATTAGGKMFPKLSAFFAASQVEAIAKA